jgi:hypothetical protein
MLFIDSHSYKNELPTALSNGYIFLTWVMPVCYFNASNDKHSQTHHSVCMCVCVCIYIYIYIYIAHYAIYSKVVPICYMFRLGLTIIWYMYKC